MTTETIKHTYQFKRGPSENWREKNPVLLEGEPGFETDTYKLKLGDGFTPYNLLPYVNASSILVIEELPLTGIPNTLYINQNDDYSIWIWDNEQFIPLSSGTDLKEYVDNALSTISKNIHDGTNYGLWQESEKEDTAFNLKFTDVPLTEEERIAIAKTYNRTATGKTSVALGSSAAPGSRALAAGSSNVAAGDKSVALGCDNYTGNNQSVALGYANYSAGSSSIALGHQNRSTGAATLATGTETEASGDAAVSMNTGTKAIGKFSAAFGNQTRATGDNQFVVGKFNVPNQDTYFIVGNGTQDTDRKNALEVYHNGMVRLPQNTYDNFIMEGNKIDGSEIITLDILSQAMDDIHSNVVKQKTRANATGPYDFGYNQNSVPYVYGRYGKLNDDGITYTETEGLIKGSIGGIKVLINEQIDIDLSNGIIDTDTAKQYKNNINIGLIPEPYRYMLDVHTIPIRDGNCAIPVGLHYWEEDSEGNVVEGSDELWYGGAAPSQWVTQKLFYGELVPIARGRNNLNSTQSVRGWDTGLQQVTEEKYEKSGILLTSKNPTAAEIIDEKHDEIKTNLKLDIDPTKSQAIGALGLYSASFGGCSSAQGKRAFAEGTNTIAFGDYSHVEGDNSVTLGKDSHAEGYATTTYGQAAHAEGSGSVAYGNFSHAGGALSIAYGDASFAHGSGAIAGGIHSTAFGNQTRANIDNQFVVGKFNNNKIDTFFEVGCGDDSNTPKNAFETGKKIETQEHFIRIGDIELTDTQLQKLLDLIQE